MRDCLLVQGAHSRDDTSDDGVFRGAGTGGWIVVVGCGMIRYMPEGMRCPRCDSRTSRLERVTDHGIDASCSTCAHRWHMSGSSLTSQTRQDIQLEVLNRELPEPPIGAE